jgi:hypothetical protein
MKQEVQDKPTEKGILVNNILTFLVLSTLGWVGYNIDNTNKILVDLRVSDVKIITQLAYVQEGMKEHKTEFNDLKVDVNLIKSDVDRHSLRIDNLDKQINYAGE